MKRVWMVCAVTLAIIFFVPFFLPDEAEEKSGMDVTTLHIALWDYDMVSYDKAVIEAFETSHPNIRLEVHSFNSLYYESSLESLLISDTAIDVIYVNQLPQLRLLKKYDFPLPLNYYIQRDSLDMSSYLAPEVFRDPVSEQYLGLPYRNDRFLLYYNKTLLDTLGIPYPASPISWDAYVDYAGEVAAAMSERGMEGKAVFLFDSPGHQMCYALGSPFSFKEDSFELLRPGLETFRTMQENGMSTDLTEMDRIEGMQQMFSSGDYAMMLNGNWEMNMLAKGFSGKQAAFAWGVTDIPRTDINVPITAELWQSPLCINKHSTKVEAAWEFLKFACGPNGGEIMAEHLVLPGYQSPAVLNAYKEALGKYGVDSTLCLEFGAVSQVPSSEEYALQNDIYDLYERALLGLDSIGESIAAMTALRDSWNSGP
ncbi:ABC transporter substrate-binding protein [uncultured Oscillibacter sp.]|uniref:ABC transporter substrate-binding protein n=1 Tax=uncultured Oscillibacter sp. TaxID=876091 RepID=UPI00272D1738|nr:extracellular solute-binding protein [uncultured Oscillibacter sp.]